GGRFRARCCRRRERRRVAAVPPLDLEGARTAPAAHRPRSIALHLEGLSRLGQAGQAQLVVRELSYTLSTAARSHRRRPLSRLPFSIARKAHSLARRGSCDTAHGAFCACAL